MGEAIRLIGLPLRKLALVRGGALDGERSDD
jgi:hypothetical protein